MYWKDIKESNDVNDVLGFLAKFPSGIYADLARRRLKNLGAAMPTDPTTTLVSPHALVPAFTSDAGDTDKTLPLPKRHILEANAPVDQEKPNADSAQAAPQPAAVAAPAASPRKAVWLVAGAAVLGVVGVTFKLLSGSGPAPEAMSAVTPASSATPQSSASAPALARLGAASAAVLPALAAASTARPAASATGGAARAALAASKEAASLAARKAASDKNKPGKEVDAKPSDTSPRAACEDRILLSFQICMAAQCAKPAFTQHPICVERRVMEERRSEAERNR